jgi:hypothetical protein
VKLEEQIIKLITLLVDNGYQKISVDGVIAILQTSIVCELYDPSPDDWKLVVGDVAKEITGYHFLLIHSDGTEQEVNNPEEDI